ncbi:MAG: YihY/virulence factor BrkB family protein [Oscillospiraceae bacterium]|jgi:membrane protein|nr:YihY/virulence factor BrkB family protein [Oscillospiraceae bacterium]
MKKIVRFAKRVIKIYNKLAGEEDMFGRAAQTTYYLMMACFPLGLLGALVFNRFHLGMPRAEGLLPVEVLDMIGGIRPPESSGPVLIMGSVWAASAAVWALMRAVHTAQTGRRLTSAWARIAAVAFMLGFIAVLALSLSLMVLGRWFGIAASWFAVFLLLFALYNLSFTPKKQRVRPRRNAVSAAVAAALWMLATCGFGTYIRYFASYTKRYGATGAFLALSVWLYIISVVVIFGAEMGCISWRKTGEGS